MLINDIPPLLGDLLFAFAVSNDHIHDRTANLTVQESQYVISLADYSINEYVLVCSHSLGRNPKFVATVVDLGRELLRRKIKFTYGGGSVGLQGAVASTVFTNGGLVRGFIPGYIATRRVYGPTYGVEHAVSSNYYKYFEMNHVVEAFIVLHRGVDTMEDDAVRQNFMASSQRKLFISSFSVDEILDKLEFAKAFPGPGVRTANLTVQESQYVISLADYSINEYVLVCSHSLGRNPKFVATVVDLGRELLRRKIKFTYGGGSVGLQGAVASTVFTNGGLVRGSFLGT
ncbi:hypothetical protein DM860_014981 [Cuscuta australis]|uniref:Uncharacterized protein n=1 Tax=Cuscuta australis TaxID=267555 RepID=A0A328DFJ4_9ASTE|nr:hypothetical protein DM860_014981 [Cuscuta australis]